MSGELIYHLYGVPVRLPTPEEAQIILRNFPRPCVGRGRRRIVEESGKALSSVGALPSFAIPENVTESVEKKSCEKRFEDAVKHPSPSTGAINKLALTSTGTGEHESRRDAAADSYKLPTRKLNFSGLKFYPNEEETQALPDTSRPAQSSSSRLPRSEPSLSVVGESGQALSNVDELPQSAVPENVTKTVEKISCKKRFEDAVENPLCSTSSIDTLALTSSSTKGHESRRDAAIDSSKLLNRKINFNGLRFYPEDETTQALPHASRPAQSFSPRPHRSESYPGKMFSSRTPVMVEPQRTGLRRPCVDFHVDDDEKDPGEECQRIEDPSSDFEE